MGHLNYACSHAARHPSRALRESPEPSQQQQCWLQGVYITRLGVGLGIVFRALWTLTSALAAVAFLASMSLLPSPSLVGIVACIWEKEPTVLPLLAPPGRVFAAWPVREAKVLVVLRGCSCAICLVRIYPLLPVTEVCVKSLAFIWFCFPVSPSRSEMPFSAILFNLVLESCWLTFVLSWVFLTGFGWLPASLCSQEPLVSPSTAIFGSPACFSVALSSAAMALNPGERGRRRRKKGERKGSSAVTKLQREGTATYSGYRRANLSPRKLLAIYSRLGWLLTHLPDRLAWILRRWEPGWLSWKQCTHSHLPQLQMWPFIPNYRFFKVNIIFSFSNNHIYWTICQHLLHQTKRCPILHSGLWQSLSQCQTDTRQACW